MSIVFEDGKITDSTEYFPELYLADDENVEEFLHKLNWIMETFEAYKKEHKSLSLRLITATSIISDMQRENRQLEKENEILKETSPGEITKTINEMKLKGEL